MINKPIEEWTEEDWKRLRRESLHLSDKLLETAQDQGAGDEFSPQVAGYALLIAMGRLSSLHGFRSIPGETAWELWTDKAAKREFMLAFELERQKEN